MDNASAVIDKADHAIQLYKATQKDIDSLEHVLRRGYKKPNFMHIVYKNRSGVNNLIIWTQLNHGNMRENLCFITDTDYNLLSGIQPMYFKFSDENQLEQEIEQ